MDNRSNSIRTELVLLSVLTGVLISSGLGYLETVLFIISVLVFQTPAEYSVFVLYGFNTLIILILLYLIIKVFKSKRIELPPLNNINFWIIGFAVLIMAIVNTLALYYSEKIFSSETLNQLQLIFNSDSLKNAEYKMTDGVISIIKQITFLILFFALAFKIKRKTAPNNGERP